VYQTTYKNVSTFYKKSWTKFTTICSCKDWSKKLVQIQIKWFNKMIKITTKETWHGKLKDLLYLFNQLISNHWLKLSLVQEDLKKFWITTTWLIPWMIFLMINLQKRYKISTKRSQCRLWKTRQQTHSTLFNQKNQVVSSWWRKTPTTQVFDRVTVLCLNSFHKVRLKRRKRH